MGKYIKPIIAITAIILVLVGIALLKKFTGPSARVPENEPNATGAMAGNLYNKGLFAESNGRVYFSNAYDNGALYSMNPDQSDMKKLSSGNASQINVLNGYIYYYSSSSSGDSGLGYVRNGRGLYRVDSEGKSTFSLARCETDGMIVVGNHLYFTNYKGTDSSGNAIVTLDRVSTSGEDETEVIGQHIVLGGYANGNIYYGGVNRDHYLRTYSTSTGSEGVVSENSVYMPVVSDSYVYYLDLEDDYHLKRLSLYDGSISTIVEERIDTYNVYGSTIFFQNVDPNGYALKRVNADGSGLEVVANGVYCDINVTSTYTYFKSFNNDLPIYQTPTTGPVNVSNFDAALNAVSVK